MFKTLVFTLAILVSFFSNAAPFTVIYYGKSPNMKMIENLLPESFILKYPKESWSIFIESHTGKAFDNTWVCSATVGLIPAILSKEYPSRTYKTIGAREYKNNFYAQEETQIFHNECIEKSIKNMTQQLLSN